MPNTINLNKINTYVTIWLYLSLFLVSALIFIGGLTRLTESGLSITNWELFSGILPPFTEKQWQDYFSLYKQIPQYKEINLGMSLAEFKYIFWWEYIHRLLARVVALAFVLPFIYFLTKKIFMRSNSWIWISQCAQSNRLASKCRRFCCSSGQ